MQHMREDVTSKTYDIWAKIYDNSFGALVRRRQRRAVEQLQTKPGDRILDLGVGTGLTLRHYKHDVTVVGMDLSWGMLKKAKSKCNELGLDHCTLVQGDAMMPPFAEGSFDHIVVTHVISVVSDPAKLLQWAQRLVKPGGRVVILNHFQSTNRFVGWVEKSLNPMFIKIGWKSDLALEDVLVGVDLDVEYCFKMSLVDIWRIVVLRRPIEGEAARAAPETIESIETMETMPQEQAAPIGAPQLI